MRSKRMRKQQVYVRKQKSRNMPDAEATTTAVTQVALQAAKVTILS